MKRIKFFMPPPRWRFPFLVVIGAFLGIFLFLLYVSNAGSYLSDNPKACVNCHIMAPQYATWVHSSHRQYTHCNKYYFKAKDGLRHATLFTLRMEPQVIHIKLAGQRVVQNNCVRCHQSLLVDEPIQMLTAATHQYRLSQPCWSCHRETPHGRTSSLSSVPYARVPLPESPVPEWLNKILQTEK